MPVLTNSRHEIFALGVARGLKPAQAYVKAGYKNTEGVNASACRLLKHQRVCERIVEVREQISKKVIENVVTCEIGDRNERVKALQERWLALRQIVLERSQDPNILKVPGGRSGHVVLTWRSGKKVAEVDTGLLRELRAHEEQAARELGQWVEKQAQTDSKGKDVLTLSQLLTLEELTAIERRLKDGKITVVDAKAELAEAPKDPAEPA